MSDPFNLKFPPLDPATVSPEFGASEAAGYRDDTTFAGSGPYGQPQADRERSNWEPWPLTSFDMPPPRASRPQFVAANVAQQVVDAYQSKDREALRAAIDRLADAIDPPNQNSGNQAPIQGT